MDELEIISHEEAIKKGLNLYFTGKPCKRGHVSERRVLKRECVDCQKEYMKEYYQQNKEEILESRKEYHQQNKKELKEYYKEYYKQNREQLLAFQKEYYKQNKENKKEYDKEYRQQNKEQINGYRRNRYATDDNVKTTEIFREMLKRTLKATNSTKESRTHELLGYCNEQLKESIESKFLEDMSWDSYGEWHIDHVYPVSRCVSDGIVNPSVINALDNLIPMWASHNISKKDKTLEEFLTDRPELFSLYGHFLK